MSRGVRKILFIFILPVLAIIRLPNLDCQSSIGNRYLARSRGKTHDSRLTTHGSFHPSSFILHPLFHIGAVPDPNVVEEIVLRYAEASSVLVPQLGGHSKDFFGPRKVLDNDWSTCWSEGVDGIGRDEWVRVVWLSQEVPKYIAVLPGWAKNKARWNNNPRLRDAQIILSNGYRQSASFDDRMQIQFVKLSSDRPAAWAQVIIRSVFEGKRFMDTSISEIKVFRYK